METWKSRLREYKTEEVVLFSPEFFKARGNKIWSVTDADKEAAAALHTQLATRVATQSLRYGDGVESAALDSLYRLFGYAREIQDRNFGANHFEELSWYVLNTYVRPFTAKWHKRSLSGALGALDDTDEFRSELEGLQPILNLFDELLLDIRDGSRSQRVSGGDKVAARLEEELSRPLAWGIIPTGSKIERETADRVNEAERIAIKKRREVYGIPPDRTYATGLALSGGGIRSATFSLGVLVALAKRNLLPDFDYLSTVSGGGYLGSFLTTFLSTETGVTKDRFSEIGLKRDQLPFQKEEGEAQAIRHLRHHSKYLQTSFVERILMALYQLYGMFVNGLALALIPAIVALAEYLLRDNVGRFVSEAFPSYLLFGGVACVVLLPSIMTRLMPKRIASVEYVIRYLTGFTVGTAIWITLGVLHNRTDFFSAEIRGASPYTLALYLSAIIPVLSAIFIALLGRRNERAQNILGTIAGLVTPAFVLGFELVIFQWLTGAGPNIGGQVVGMIAPVISLWHWSVNTHDWLRPMALIVGILVIAVFVYLPLDINFTSPHRHYRRKLAEAFLIQPAQVPTPQQPFAAGVQVKLSEMNSQARAPYHILNAALNVPASKNPAMQGRLTDFFVFSRDYCGSPLTGYTRTSEWEKLDPNLTLATAMATSGAATSPLMGLQTKRYQTFWLAMLNVRLGYWLKNPFRKGKCKHGTPGALYLLKEMFGKLHERGRYLNVTDGGHIENLGVYELLRRRCKYIVAVDGEHDPAMTFHALTTLQRLASIDLDITIDIDLDDLRLREGGLSRSHFQMCRIHYPSHDGQPEIGYLIYVKLSLTGNEGEFIRRYRLDEPAFPHHPTANQFFTEAQFEAYRSLGEHVGEKLFMRAIVGDLPKVMDLTMNEWFLRAGKSILS